jgi:peptide chain release factor
MIPFRVSSEKSQELDRKMKELGIREEDLEETFIKGSGKGGQKKNKTSSCVVLTHRPTGIQVRCQQERSHSLNRFLARRDLCDKLAALIQDEETKAERARFKIRKQKQRRTKKAKEKILAQKKIRSDQKRLRGRLKPSS